MFRITLWSDNIPHDLYALERYGLGGSEAALTNLAWEFAELGHHVTVLCQSPNGSHKYKNIVCHDLNSPYKQQALDCDLFISLRSGLPFLTEDLSKAKTKVFWSQDTRYHGSIEHLFVNTKGLLFNIDKIVVISDYSYNQIKKEGVEAINNKLVKIQNGYQHRFLISPVKNQDIINCVYASQPDRGLQYLIDMWPAISKEVPEARLHLFSSRKLYGQGQDSVNEWMFVRAKRYPNIEVHEPVCQKELSAIYSTMDCYLYSNAFEEAGCMALKEAMANHCTAVVSNLGALTEKVERDKNGFVICGHPDQSAYQIDFVAKTVELLSNKEVLRSFQAKAYETVVDWTWANRANSWLDLLNE